MIDFDKVRYLLEISMEMQDKRKIGQRYKHMENLRPLYDDSKITMRREWYPFVIQTHKQKKYHYDLRILSNTENFLLSWQIPNTILFDKMIKSQQADKIKLLAIESEPHPLRFLDVPKMQQKMPGQDINLYDSGVVKKIIYNEKICYFIFKGKKINGAYIFININKDKIKEYNQSWLMFKKIKK